MGITEVGDKKENAWYIDKRGYYRFKDTDTLIHRHNAFKEMEVHHIDGVLSNNKPDNLLICTKIQHLKIHSEINKLKEQIKALEQLNG